MIGTVERASDERPSNEPPSNERPASPTSTIHRPPSRPTARHAARRACRRRAAPPLRSVPLRALGRPLLLLTLLFAGPLGPGRTVPAAHAAADEPASSSPSPGGSHVVQAGDTLYSIGRRSGVSVDALVWANKLADENVIRRGQKLVIPTVSGKLHTVQPEDTLEGIAGTYGVGLDRIAEVNGLAASAALSPGRRILVPMPLKAPVTEASPGEASPDASPEAAPVIVAAAQAEASQPIPVPAAEEPPAGAAPGGRVQASAPTVKPSPAPSPSVTPRPAPSGTPTVRVRTTRVATLAWPIVLKSPTIVVTQPFRPGHRGIDIAAPVGTPIKAAAGGTVIAADQGDSGYGWKIVLDHGQGVHTWYAHLGEFAVALGDRVEAGQKIGLVGTTGLATGPHLHFELRVNDIHVDPRMALP